MRFPLSPLSQAEGVLDLRVRHQHSPIHLSSSSGDSESDADAATNANRQGGDVEKIGSNGGDENDSYAANEEDKAELIQNAALVGDRKVRLRFGPDENYLLAVQVNVDAPYKAEHGDVNKQWQALADKLNGSTNFNMKAGKRTTVKARFKALLAKHRAWESKSATKSGTDEAETPFIQIMTDIASSVDDFEAQVASKTAVKKGEQLAKERSGEVVRQAAVARIKLGKRHARGEDSDEESAENEMSTVQQQRPIRNKTPPEWVTRLEESKTQRASLFQDFLQQQQTDQERRLDFEREERAKYRDERSKERKEHQLEREERQQERDLQSKLIASLLERLANNQSD